MDYYIYSYQCTVWEPEQKRVQGIVVASSYEDAMARISDYYGEEAINEVTLHCESEENPIVEFESKDLYDAFLAALNY